MDSHQTRELHEAPIRRLLLRFSIPVIVGMLVNSTYNIVARIFVGKFYGNSAAEAEQALAALTVSLPIMLILMAFGMMIGTGTGALISIRLGEQNKEGAERLLGLAMFLYIALSVFFMIFGLIFLEPMLSLFGASETAMPLAKQYMRIIILGVLFHELSFGMNGLLAAEGKPVITMVTMLISAILNIFFDYLFIVVLRTDIWGAALSSVLAQIVSSTWILWYYLSGRSLLRLKWSNIKFNPDLSLSIAIIGMPHFVMQSAACFLQAIQNRQLRHYGGIFGEMHGFEGGGDRAMAVMGIIFSVYSIFIMPLIGLSRGMQPIVGYNIGAKQYHRVRRTLLLGLMIATVFGFLFYIPIYTHTETFVAIFAKEHEASGQEFIALGAYALRVVAWMFPTVGISILISGYFQACGMSMVSLIQTLLRQVFILVPMILILPHVFEYFGHPGLDGIWYATPISDLGAFVYCLGWLAWELRRLSRLCREPDEEPPEDSPNTEVIVREIEREVGGMYDYEVPPSRP